MDRKRKEQIIERLRATYRDAQTELLFETPYQLLVATMMAAQSTDRQVNKVTRGLFADHPDASQMVRLRAEELEGLISSVGLYRNKAKHILAMSELLLERHAGEVPPRLEDLVALPGVGRKTANVVLSNAFGIPAFAVDTHVFRTARRLGLSTGKTPQAVEQDLMRVFNRSDWGDAHHWLIHHGRRVCLAKRPRCVHCPLRDLCDSPDRTDR